MCPSESGVGKMLAQRERWSRGDGVGLCTDSQCPYLLRVPRVSFSGGQGKKMRRVPGSRDSLEASESETIDSLISEPYRHFPVLSPLS